MSSVDRRKLVISRRVGILIVIIFVCINNLNAGGKDFNKRFFDRFLKRGKRGEFYRNYKKKSSNIYLSPICFSPSADTKLTESCFICGGLDWSPDGTKIIFASSKDNDLLDIFDISPSGGPINNLTLTSDDVEFSPKYSSDGSKIYCTILDFSTGVSGIYKMNSDGTNKTLIKQFSENEELEDFILSPFETKISYVLDEGNYGSLWIMNIDGTNSIELTKCKEWDRFDFSPDGNYIVFKDTNGYISKINITTKELTQLTTVHSYSPDWSPVEDKIVYTAYNASWQKDIYVMNSDGTGKTNLTNLSSGYPYEPKYSPDGTKISYGYYDWNTDEEAFYVMNSDGINKIKIADVEVWDSVWSPDSSKIAYTDYQNIFIVNSDGTNLQNITGNTLPIMNENPCWNGNFTKIAYIAEYPDVNKLMVMDSDGSNKIELDSVDTRCRTFSFYPHPTKIVYSTDTYDANIFTVNYDGTGKTQLTFDGESVFPSWSPDLSKIAYYSYDESIGECLKIMNSDGSNQIILAEAECNELPPEWSSDGTEIVYLYGTSWDNQSIWIVNISSPFLKTEVVSGIYDYCAMTFSPDEQKIAYAIWWDYDNPDNEGLWVVNRDGTGKQQIYQGEIEWEERIIWAENNRIYFAGEGYIYSIKPDGTDLIQESSNLGWGFDIDRADGSKLVYNAFDIFLASEGGVTLYSISGYIKDSSGNGIEGVTVSLTGEISSSTITNSAGYYEFIDLKAGDYTITPSKTDWVFSPFSYSVTLNKDVIVNFTGAPVGTVSIPAGENENLVTVERPEAGKIKVIVEEKAKHGKGVINPDKNEGIFILINPKEKYTGKEYKIKVFNLIGEIVDEFLKIPQSIDDIWIKWIPENLSSGIYIVYVEGPGVKDWKKIAILR